MVCSWAVRASDASRDARRHTPALKIECSNDDGDPRSLSLEGSAHGVPHVVSRWASSPGEVAMAGMAAQERGPAVIDAMGRWMVAKVFCIEGCPLAVRLRNANPATISYGAAQGHKERRLNDSPGERGQVCFHRSYGNLGLAWR